MSLFSDCFDLNNTAPQNVKLAMLSPSAVSAKLAMLRPSVVSAKLAMLSPSTVSEQDVTYYDQ